MNYKKRVVPKPFKKRDLSFEEIDENRLVEMAWQDRTPFDIIYLQYGLTENQVKNKLRKLMSKKLITDGEKEFKAELQNILKNVPINQIDLKGLGKEKVCPIYQK